MWARSPRPRGLVRAKARARTRRPGYVSVLDPRIWRVRELHSKLLVRGGVGPRNKARAVRANDLRGSYRSLSANQRSVVRLRGLLPSPSVAAIQGISAGRESGLQVPRTQVRPRRPLRVDAGTGRHSQGYRSARLPGGRKT